MDRVIFLGCALLLALGMLIGLGLDSSASLFTNLRAAFELLSFAGTAATAVVAVVALSSWHTQFRHSEKWKAIKKFQGALDGGRSATAYLNSLFSVAARNYRDWGGRTVDFMNGFQSEQKAWFDQCALVEKAWQELCLLLDEKDMKVFSVIHESIEIEVGDVASLVIGEFLKADAPNIADLYDATQRCSTRARDRTNQIFSQSGELQKKLVS